MDYAMAEVERDRLLWEYFDGVADEDVIVCDDEDTFQFGEEQEEPEFEAGVPESEGADGGQSAAEGADPKADLEVHTGGAPIRILEDPEHEDGCTHRVLGRSKRRDNTVWMQEIVTFLHELQQKVIDHIPDVCLRVLTEHRRGTNVFRGHPNFRGEGPWKDWAIVDWGRKWGKLPSHIWCFVSLSQMPTGRKRIQHGGQVLEDGVCAVCEVAECDKDAVNITKSDLFTPLLLETKGLDEDGDVIGRQFHLANTEAIVGPCSVIPDIGGPKNAYFEVKNRASWSAEFVTWLKTPHKDDGMECSDEDSDDE